MLIPVLIIYGVLVIQWVIIMTQVITTIFIISERWMKKQWALTGPLTYILFAIAYALGWVIHFKTDIMITYFDSLILFVFGIIMSVAWSGNFKEWNKDKSKN